MPDAFPRASESHAAQRLTLVAKPPHPLRKQLNRRASRLKRPGRRTGLFPVGTLPLPLPFPLPLLVNKID
jgi:hypothetical protein